MKQVKMVWLGAVFAVVSVGPVAVAQDDGRSAAKGSKPTVQRLSCSNPKSASDKLWAGPHDAIAGPVRFGDARGDHHPRRKYKPRLDPFRVLKSPLRVDAGKRVRIEVALADRGHIKLGYGHGSNDGADVLDVTACPDKKQTTWIGAFLIDGPRCARLRVIHRGTMSILRIPFGRGTCRSG